MVAEVPGAHVVGHDLTDFGFFSDLPGVHSSRSSYVPARDTDATLAECAELRGAAWKSRLAMAPA